MRPTKEGKKFLLATLLITVAALNTGNNLIYLILAMMLSILALSLLLLRLNLSGLKLDFSVEGPLFAKEKAVIRVFVSNAKRFLPSYSLKVLLPQGIKGEGHIPYVPASSTAPADVAVFFEKRGVYRQKGFAFLESGFPFIFFLKRKKTQAETELVVYPEVKDVGGLGRLTGGEYQAYSTLPGEGEEMLFIREFRYGDDMKKISWKATAKADKLMVKEFALDEPMMLTILLDNINPPNKEAFEKAVSFAASVSVRFIREGFFVRLITCKEVLPFGNTMEHLYRILYALAVIEEHDTWECPIAEEELPGGSLLVLKSEDSAAKILAPKCSMVVYATSL